ncbi:hypothetical protein [Desulforegula conservatrix]|uniref:hypothetical protein n=1 Tax=Desulforegula conservatrix TaxID=153026 RepID=UPI0003F9218F|nr:hypothetical protein [Desulforegula conservatrix]
MKSLLLKCFLKTPVLLIVVTFLITGCGVRVMVPVMRPAEINLNGKQRLAMGFFEGNIGRRASDLIESRLSAAGYFELINSPVTDHRQSRWHGILNRSKR